MGGKADTPPALLSRAAILAADDLPTEDVAIPEWDGPVRVRALTALEADAYDAESTRRELKGEPRHGRVRLVVLCCVDETGAQLFEESDALALAAKCNHAINTLYAAAADLNGLTAAEAQIIAGN